MKKLILAAAIVSAAAVSHGAALTWGLTGIDSSISGVSKGSVGYFMAASTWEAFSAADAAKKGAYCVGNNLYSGEVSSGRSGLGLSHTDGSYSAGDSIEGYIVLFDNANAEVASYYANTGVLSTKVAAAGDATIQPTFANSTSGWLSASGSPVPEPTSGLMLLFGVGLMALRRRRA